MINARVYCFKIKLKVHKTIQKEMQGLRQLLNKSIMLLINGSLHIYASSNTLRAYPLCRHTLCQNDFTIKTLSDS